MRAWSVSERCLEVAWTVYVCVCWMVSGGRIDFVFKVAESVRRVSGGCLEGVWMVSSKCLEGFLRGCLEGVWKVSVGCLECSGVSWEGVGMVPGSCLEGV